MSDATERPADRRAEPDADAWADACAEDLAAEKARHRAAHGPQPGSATEELRKLAEAVTDKLAGIQLPGALGGIAAQGAVSQLFKQAKAAVEPVIERNPDLFDHLAAASTRAARRLPLRRREQRAPLDPRRSRRGSRGPPR